MSKRVTASVSKGKGDLYADAAKPRKKLKSIQHNFFDIVLIVMLVK